jgi:hypothetical protein
MSLPLRQTSRNIFATIELGLVKQRSYHSHLSYARAARRSIIWPILRQLFCARSFKTEHCGKVRGLLARFPFPDGTSADALFLPSHSIGFFPLCWIHGAGPPSRFGPDIQPPQTSRPFIRPPKASYLRISAVRHHHQSDNQGSHCRRLPRCGGTSPQREATKHVHDISNCNTITNLDFNLD